MADGPPARRILGDWGTSNLRLWLVAGDTVIDRRDGPGLTAAGPDERPEGVFAGLVKPWVAAHGPLPAFLCGMVGANIGWQQVPYLECPANAADLAARLTMIDTASGPVGIVPGLACQNPLGAPDVMRGEETQIIGAGNLGDSAMASDGTSPDSQLFCLPGTHSKWATVANGKVRDFQTVMTGELFALLRGQSTLLDRTMVEPSLAGFDAGLSRVRACGTEAVPALLFEVRSRRLRSAMRIEDASGFLSGILIGAELATIASQREDREIGAVTIVGDPALGTRYSRAITLFGGQAAMIDGDEAVRKGLSALSNLAGART